MPGTWRDPAGPVASSRVLAVRVRGNSRVPWGRVQLVASAERVCSFVHRIPTTQQVFSRLVVVVAAVVKAEVECETEERVASVPKIGLGWASLSQQQCAGVLWCHTAITLLTGSEPCQGAGMVATRARAGTVYVYLVGSVY